MVPGIGFNSGLRSSLTDTSQDTFLDSCKCWLYVTELWMDCRCWRTFKGRPNSHCWTSSGQHQWLMKNTNRSMNLGNPLIQFQLIYDFVPSLLFYMVKYTWINVQCIDWMLLNTDIIEYRSNIPLCMSTYPEIDSTKISIVKYWIINTVLVVF